MNRLVDQEDNNIIKVRFDNNYQQQQINNLQNIELKKDYQKRPLWLTPDLKIFLETFNPLYRQAYEFIISIAMPVSRPQFIQEYHITQYSLYSAMVLQLTPIKIVQYLNSLCKNKEIPEQVEQFIYKNTQNYGSTKLFLKDNSYYLQIYDMKVLERVGEIIADLQEVEVVRIDGRVGNIDMDQKMNQINNMINNNEQLIQQIENIMDSNLNVNNVQQESRIYKILCDHYKITKLFIQKNIPIIEEYDISRYQNSSENQAMQYNMFPDLEIELKQSTKIRDYQEKALSKIFIENKGRSGVVVLPCGAGKTLVGIVSISMIKKRTIVFCNSTMVIPQWKNQLLKFTNIKEEDIICLSSKKNYFDEHKWKKNQNKGYVILTTYTMVSKKREINSNSNNNVNSASSIKNQIIMDMKKIEWGLCLLDEVQVVPANTFQKVLLHMKAHFKLGLTATLVREDQKIVDLNYMIGPKLYEENWLDLINSGYLARPYCVEVRLPMTSHFKKAYQQSSIYEHKIMLHNANPNKYLALQYLIQKHQQRGDQIIVFGDKPYILIEYAKRLKLPVATGNVSNEERNTILSYFVKKKIQTIILSSIGDTAIDLPDASVVIQISSFFRSRKQEAQRLGRILRPKENDNSRFNAFFYTLVSLETDETLYAQKRQRFLIDQGFSFEIVTRLGDSQGLDMEKEEEQVKWLINIQQYLENRRGGRVEKNEVETDYYEDNEDQVDLGQNRNPLNINSIYIQQ